MQTSYTPAQIERLKREAKRRSRATDLTHSQALDLVAVEHGFRNWSLLAKRSEASVSDAVTVDLVPYPNSLPGIYLVRIVIRDRQRHLGVGAATDGPQFELPSMPGWMFRPATDPQYVYAPFMRPDPWRGVFVNGEWRAILSRNGVQDSEIESHIRLTLPAMLAQLQARAAVAVEQWWCSGPPQDGFRLFFTRPQSGGVSELVDRRFRTLNEAKDAQLPTGWVKVGIPLGDGWLHYQDQFGWQGPFKH